LSIGLITDGLAIIGIPYAIASLIRLYLDVAAGVFP
jgi:hypothetical protein